MAKTKFKQINKYNFGLLVISGLGQNKYTEQLCDPTIKIQLPFEVPIVESGSVCDQSLALVTGQYVMSRKRKLHVRVYAFNYTTIYTINQDIFKTILQC